MAKPLDDFDFNDADWEVQCARCGKKLMVSQATPEEGDEWECLPCNIRCNAAELDEALRNAVTIPDDVPTAECPRCGFMQEDHDGFGVLHCANCGYCTHASQSGDRCDLCKALVSSAKGSPK